MSDLNDLKLFGRIVKDASFQFTNNDKKKAFFTLAVNRTRKDQNGNYYDEPNFFPISAYVTDKIALYLKKGQPLLIEGELFQKSKELGTDENGKRLFDSRIYINTKKIHIIFTGKKEIDSNDNEKNISEIPEEDFIYEPENITSDFYMDDTTIF